MNAELRRAVSELRDAFGRAETIEDVRLLCGVAADLAADLDQNSPLRSAERALALSTARLDRMRRRVAP